jgi:hypothetical protein
MIKIEVTGNSLGEVADKLLAVGASLRATDNQRIYDKAARAEARFTEAELGEIYKIAAAPDPTPAPKSAPVATVTESQPTTEELSSTPAPAASASELSFETDVTPVVLAVVQTKGKPVVEDILSQFGVARASQLDPARWPELLAALQDKL